MNFEEIVQSIGNESIGQDNHPVLMIQLKPHITSCAYEIFGEDGSYIAGSFSKQLDLVNISNNQNLLMFNLTSKEKLQYCIKIFNVACIQTNIRFRQTEMQNEENTLSKIFFSIHTYVQQEKEVDVFKKNANEEKLEQKNSEQNIVVNMVEDDG